MTREDITARIAELQKQLEQATANCNAIGGAIQDCNFWLAQLEKPEAEEK